MEWDQIIKLCKESRICTQGHIALWLDIKGISAYLIFQQLKDMCKEGLLEDDEFECIASKRKIIFKPKSLDMGEEEGEENFD